VADRSSRLNSRLPEMTEINRLIDDCSNFCRVERLADVSMSEGNFSIEAFTFGTKDLTAPVVVFLGGVHGLERIGTRVVLSALQTFSQLAQWDYATQKLLEAMRVIFIPLVNPGGMYRGWRANPNGVDLMRNAPVEAEVLPKLKLLAGHRLSPKLPWYRGKLGEPMEVESTAIVNFFTEQVFKSKFACSMDVHSGFGIIDRLWFPFAHSRRKFPHIAEILTLKKKLDQTYPYHVYQIEPQSTQYTTHGDLWDHLFYLSRKNVPGGDMTFLPLSLELGSWTWIRKNPRQLLSVSGIFNPIVPHRLFRIQRRHLLLFDFLTKAVLSSGTIFNDVDSQRIRLDEEAEKIWYQKFKQV
jgi:hypothetical protein